MTEDRLPELARRLDELAARPVSTHPDVLDHVHGALADELDDLTRTGGAQA